MTNTVQGDVQSATIGTYMAINGDGFFVVQKPSSSVDNQPIFDGIDRYTRRGDFQPDKNGYLVNGAGYFLIGIPIDPATGNRSEVFRNFCSSRMTSCRRRPPRRSSIAPTSPTIRRRCPCDPVIPRSVTRPDYILLQSDCRSTRCRHHRWLRCASRPRFVNAPCPTQRYAANYGDGLGGVPVNYDLVFADTDTLNDVIGDINALAGLNAAVTATIDTSGGTNKLRIDADSADIDFEIAAFSGDALTGRLGLAEGVPHLSSNLMDSGGAQACRSRHAGSRPHRHHRADRDVGPGGRRNPGHGVRLQAFQHQLVAGQFHGDRPGRCAAGDVG